MRQSIPLLLAAAFAAPVVADTPEKAAAFLGAMRAAGCAMSLADADAGAEGIGIELHELDEIIDLLYLGGQIDIDDEEGMTLAEGLCAADPAGDEPLFARLQADIDLDAFTDPGLAGLPEIDPALGAGFIGAIRAGNCTVPQDKTPEILSAAGMTEPEARAAFAVLYETGHVVPIGSWDAFRLSDALCSADPAGDAALFAAAASNRLAVPAAPADPDAVLAERFGPEGVRVVLEFLADTSDCVLDTSDRADTVDSVLAFLAFNVTGIYNLPPDFSPEAEAELRATIERMLDDPGPAFAAEPGRLTLIDCTP